MPSNAFAGRFKGRSGTKRLVSLLESQVVVAGNRALARKLARKVALREAKPGEVLIEQGGGDNKVYLVLSGTVKIFVNGRHVATREAGLHIGEMSAIDQSRRRSATVIADEDSLIASISATRFMKLCHEHPEMLRQIAIELSRRLDQRKQFHRIANVMPVVFIGSSRESLSIAKALKAAIDVRIAKTVLWSKGVFGASSFPMEDLEIQLQSADFAVLVTAADDSVVSRGKKSDAPRDNVVFELGLFMGALGRRRSFMLVPAGKDLKIPSDLLGLTPIRYKSRATPSAAVRFAAAELSEIFMKDGAR